jgi:sugar phosphate isomerase/epimerase
LDLSTTPPLGLAHFTVLEVPPLELVSLAAKIGYAAVGLRLHPAFPGAPFYEVPGGSAASRELRRRLDDEGVRVYDVEFVTIGEDFSTSALTRLLEDARTLGARRLSVCGDDSDRSRLVANFSALCEIGAKFGMGVDLECMAWRRVASFPDAIAVVASAARPNGGVLVDAIHLSRTGGTPRDLRDAPAGFVRSAQLCDAVAERPLSQEAIIKEARSGRLPPGHGALPLRDLLAELPADTVLSIEVPMDGSAPPEPHARDNFEAARNFIAACRSSPARR